LAVSLHDPGYGSYGSYDGPFTDGFTVVNGDLDARFTIFTMLPLSFLVEKAALISISSTPISANHLSQ